MLTPPPASYYRPHWWLATSNTPCSIPHLNPKKLNQQLDVFVCFTWCLMRPTSASRETKAEHLTQRSAAVVPLRLQHGVQQTCVTTQQGSQVGSGEASRHWLCSRCHTTASWAFLLLGQRMHPPGHMPPPCLTPQQCFPTTTSLKRKKVPHA